MKKILVPVDFSTCSDNAVDFATGLAKAGNYKIILLHIYQVPLSPWDTISFPGDVPVSGEFVAEQVHLMERDELAKLEVLLSKTRERGVSCEKIVIPGTVTDSILDIAERRHIDQVIMGTNGAGWLKGNLLGSNASRVIQKAKCPVMVIPEKAEFNGISRIVYATDYQVSDIESIKNLVEMARLFDAGITLLHVADELYPKEQSEGILKIFSEKVEKKVRYDKLSYKLILGDAEAKLEEYVKRKHADLFVMSTLSRNVFERFFDSSLAKTIAHQSRMPLMVFHHAEDDAIFY